MSHQLAHCDAIISPTCAHRTYIDSDSPRKCSFTLGLQCILLEIVRITAGLYSYQYVWQQEQTQGLYAAYMNYKLCNFVGVVSTNWWVWFPVRFLNCALNSTIRYFLDSPLCCASKPDVVCIVESWLDGKVSDEEISISGHHIVRLDRNHRGGGILIYIRSSLSFHSCRSIWLRTCFCNHSFI